MSDFCSVCGAEILSVTPAAPPDARTASAPKPAGPSPGNCPECGAGKESDSQVFCEVCGHNFKTNQSSSRPIARTAAPPQIHTTDPQEAPPETRLAAPVAEIHEPARIAPRPPAASPWDVIIQVDGNLHGATDPAAPVGMPQQVFSLYDAETIIGRPNPVVRVQIPVAHDAGISRRHAMLVMAADGSLLARDLGSANGTRLNGVELVAGVAEPLKDGDVLAIGAWTKITLRGKLP